MSYSAYNTSDIINLSNEGLISREEARRALSNLGIYLDEEKEEEDISCEDLLSNDTSHIDEVPILGDMSEYKGMFDEEESKGLSRQELQLISDNIPGSFIIDSSDGKYTMLHMSNSRYVIMDRLED